MGAAGRENPKHVIAKTKPNTSKLSLDTWGWARCSKVTSEKRVRAPEGLSAQRAPGAWPQHQGMPECPRNFRFVTTPRKRNSDPQDTHTIAVGALVPFDFPRHQARQHPTSRSQSLSSAQPHVFLLAC